MARFIVSGRTTIRHERQPDRLDHHANLTRVAASMHRGFTPRSLYRASWRALRRMATAVGYESRPERPCTPPELRQLIRRMATDNPLWGEERIANELLLKLGIRISPRTVRRYMPKRPPGRPRGNQRWATFLRNHAQAIIACDFFVAVTATFRLLCVFVLAPCGGSAWTG